MATTQETTKGATSVESGNIKKCQTVVSTANKRKSIDQALSYAAAPVATATILLPSMNNVQKCAVITDKVHQSEVNILRDGEKKKAVLTQEKICSTPAPSALAKRKILEKKQSESIISTTEKTVDSLLSKMLRRKSQGEKM